MMPSEVRPPPPPPPKRRRGRPPGAKNVSKKLSQGHSGKIDNAKKQSAEVDSGALKTKVPDEPIEPASNLHQPTSVSSSSSACPLELTNGQNTDNLNVNNCGRLDVRTLESFHKKGQAEMNSKTNNNIQVHQMNEQVSESDVNSAMRFITSLKNFTKDRPTLYKFFLDLMENYRTHKIDVATFSSQMAVKFSAYPDVLTLFNEYLAKSNMDRNSVLKDKESTQYCERGRNFANATTAVGKILRRDATGLGYTVARCPEPYKGLTQKDEHQPLGSTMSNILRADDVLEAESLNHTAVLAINLLKILEGRLSNHPQKFQTISHALSALHVKKSCSTIQSADETLKFQTYAYEIIRENLRDQPDVLQVIDAFFNSDRKYEGLPSCMATSSTTTRSVVNDDVTSTRKVNSGFTVESHDSTLLNEASHRPFSTEETSNLSHCLSEPFSATSKIRATNKFFPVHNLTTKKPCSNIEQDPSSKEATEDIRKFLQSHLDKEKWINELVDALDYAFVRIPTLRNFIIHYLGITLFQYDDSSEDSDDDDLKAGQNRKNKKSMTSETDNFCSETYAKYPNPKALPKCSGRTKLCDQVLNNEYYICQRKTFRLNIRSKEEERLDDYEDARYEVDMMLHRNARSIEFFEDLKNNMKTMTLSELHSFQLNDNLGGTSIIHKRAVELLFYNNGKTVIEGLKMFPALYVPGVLKLLKVRDKEWIELRSRWNLLITADLRKFKNKRHRKNKGQTFVR